MPSFNIFPYVGILFLLYIISGSKTHKTHQAQQIPITQKALDSIQKELDDWDGDGFDYDGDGYSDDGRFMQHSVSYIDGALIIYITTHSSANYIAKRSFCSIVRDLHRKYAPEYYLISSITPNGMTDDKLDCNSYPLRATIYR